jgi:hypothetical protein
LPEYRIGSGDVLEHLSVEGLTEILAGIVAPERLRNVRADQAVVQPRRFGLDADEGDMRQQGRYLRRVDVGAPGHRPPGTLAIPILVKRPQLVGAEFKRAVGSRAEPLPGRIVWRGHDGRAVSPGDSV